jgi:CheY-like chemotaxis protein
MNSPLLSNIFIIDDSEIDRFLLKKFIKKNLEVAGLKIEISDFEFAQQALNFINSAIGTKEEYKIPKLVFLDINMPDMNGYEFLDELKKLPTQFISLLKVVITSSSEDADDLVTIRKYPNIHKLITKPVLDEEVVQMLEMAEILFHLKK